MGAYEMGIAADISEKSFERLEKNKRELVRDAWSLQHEIHHDANGIKLAIMGLTVVVGSLAVVDYMKRR